MENQKHNIDEIFRQRLHDSDVPPPPFVWPAVEHELRKRRRRLVLWLFTFGIIAASTWLWQSNTFDDVNLASNLKPDLHSPKTEIRPNVSSVEANSVPAEQAAVLRIVLPSPEAEIKTPVVQNTRVFSSEPQLPASHKILAKGVDPSMRSLLENSGDVQQPLSSVKSDQPSTPVFESLPKKTDAERAFFAPLFPIAHTGFVSSAQENNKGRFPKTYKAASRRKKTQPKFCYDFARHPSAWLLDVYGGPSLAQRTLTSGLEDEPYLKQRLATESRSLAVNAGLRASLMFHSNFLVRTGLHYDQMTEVFEYVDPTFVVTDINVHIVNGQIVSIDTVVSYGENYLKTYNRYTMLDVPLIVGMEIRHGRSGFSINGGISANVLFSKRGVIIDPTTAEPGRFGPTPEKPKDIGPGTALSQDVFRTKLGLSATASIQWYWHMSPRFRLFVEPSFKQVLRPVTLKNHPVEQRYSILGLRLGATKIF